MRGQPQRTPVMQYDGFLRARIAGGRFTHQGRPVVVLQHSGKEFRFPITAGIDQHHHRKLQTHAVRLRNTLCAVFADVRKEPPGREQIVQENRGFGRQPAGIVAHINDQRHSPLRKQILHRIHAGLAAAGFKVMDLNVSGAGFFQPVQYCLTVGIRAVNFNRLRSAGNGQIELFVHF